MIATPAALLAVLLAAPQGAARSEPDGASAASEPAMIQKTLANGVRVLVSRRPGTGSVSCRLAFRTGRAHDAPYPSGLAELMIRLLDQGTRRVGVRDAAKEEQLRRRVDDVEDALRLVRAEALTKFLRGEGPDPDDPAASPIALQKLREGVDAIADLHRRELLLDDARRLYARAGASRYARESALDDTSFFVTLPAARFELFCWIESDRVRDAVLRDIAAERTRLREERLAALERNPGARAEESFRAMVWGGHPYGAPAPGALSLDGVSRAELERARERMLRPGNTIIAAAGDVDPDKAIETVERYFGSWQGAPAAEEPAPRSTTPAGTRRMEAVSAGAPSVTTAWLTPPAQHRDRAALDVLAHALDGEGGLVAAALRAAKLDRTAVRARLECGRFGGWIRVEAQVHDDAQLAAADAAIQQAVERAAAGLDDAALDRARLAALHDLANECDSGAAWTRRMVEAECRGDAGSLGDEAKMLLEVTSADAARAARAWLPAAQRQTLLMRSTYRAPLPEPPKVEPPSAPPASQPASRPAEPPASAPASAPASRPAAPESKPAPASAPAPPPQPGGGA